jgi:hypothetical protein
MTLATTHPIVLKRFSVFALVPALALLVVGCASASTPSAVKPASPPPTEPSPGLASTAPALGPYSDAVNALGMSQYPNIYATDSEAPDGSVIVYVGPGSDNALLLSLKKIDPARISDAPSPGKLPPCYVVRVARSISALDKLTQIASKARPALAAKGYDLLGWTPIPERGEVGVMFHSVPRGVTAASATRYIDATIAPGLVVTSIDATTQD